MGRNASIARGKLVRFLSPHWRPKVARDDICLVFSSKAEGFAYRSDILTPKGTLVNVYTEHLDDFSGDCGLDPWASENR